MGFGYFKDEIDSFEQADKSQYDKRMKLLVSQGMEIKEEELKLIEKYCNQWMSGKN